MALGTEILILSILLFLSGFFSGAEVALVSLSKHKASQMVAERKPGALFVVRLKQDPQRMLSTILIGNNVVNVAASALTTVIVIRTFGDYAVGIATGIMTLLILIFGEITPKSIAAQHNVAVSRFVAPLIWYLSIVLTPIINVLDTFLKKFMNLVGIKATKGVISEEEILSLVKEAELEGSIKGIEQTMISNVFKFDDLNCGEISTPRADMIMVSSKAIVKDVLSLILKTKYSRIPVYGNTRDEIAGIVYLKDLLVLISEGKQNTDIQKIVKKAYFVPETKNVSSLLRQFQKRKEHMAIVVDEHGSVTGLVTLEDVLEEIVGEIMDETDKVDPHIKKVAQNIWIVKGKADVDEVKEKLKMRIPAKKDYDTFSGYIQSLTGTIPRQGEEIVKNNYKMNIEQVDSNRIISVRVEKVPAQKT